jgi:mannose-6-phosphate isomerase-like protein (cupin superfamily)
MKTKKEAFDEVEKYLLEEGYHYETKDDTRPWGGFFTIPEIEATRFASQFFSWNDNINQKISPKFLLVAPETRLSWQYHHRRSELWKLMWGEAKIVRSLNDEETTSVLMTKGELINLEKGERHRLVGANEWGVVAEIWVHTDPENPSNEEDIVRLQDDYGRK